MALRSTKSSHSERRVPADAHRDSSGFMRGKRSFAQWGFLLPDSDRQCRTARGSLNYRINAGDFAHWRTEPRNCGLAAQFSYHGRVHDLHSIEIKGVRGPGI
jgi:hypothetical protein